MKLSPERLAEMSKAMHEVMDLMKEAANCIKPYDMDRMSTALQKATEIATREAAHMRLSPEMREIIRKHGGEVDGFGRIILPDEEALKRFHREITSYPVEGLGRIISLGGRNVT